MPLGQGKFIKESFGNINFQKYCQELQPLKIYLLPSVKNCIKVNG